MSERAAALARSLEGANPDALREAVETAAHERLKRFLRAVDGYRKHPYRRPFADPPVAWSEGATRLLDYSHAPEAMGGDGPALLIAPSLVNRGYVLDLMPERSLMRALAAAGFRPYLIEWGAPGEAEDGLDLDECILGRLSRCLDVVRSETGTKPVLVGYCMGGLLALALALRRQDELSGLALLATPWDFHADGGAQSRLAAGLLAPWFPLFDGLGGLPVDVLQMFFAGLDPLLALKKFLAFSFFEPDSERAEAFVALEDWLNDGVVLPAAIARACVLGWYGENAPAKGSWLVGGTPVRPGDLRVPTLVVVPEKDRIVPPASARVLAAAIEHAHIVTPAAGHIGMVVGSNRRADLWDPLASWVSGLKA
ncbi:MAG: alpha/beta fold hydrolase [Alphaproteobacteria bacterium]|nr:alpha/beta fold hydrolase [Alphaproteobacteria bacterium]